MKLRNPFKMEYPPQVVSRWDKFAYVVHWHLYLTDLGRGQVVGKFTQVFSEVTAFLLILDKLGVTGVNLMSALVIGGIVGVIGVWGLGALCQAVGWDQIGNLVKDNRNPFMVDIYNSTCKRNKKDGRESTG